MRWFKKKDPEAERAKKFPPHNDIIIYLNYNCTYCQEAKRLLARNRIDYKEYDVSTNIEAQKEMTEKSGGQVIPVIDVGGKIMVGFNKEELQELIKPWIPTD